MTINIKQRLKALQYIDIKAKSKHQEIISLKSSILRGQQFNNMPKSENSSNRSEELNVLIIDKSEQLYQEIQELYQERDEPVENIIMRLLYIDGLSWSQIQAQLRCGRGTIHRARESALKKISKKWN